MARILAPILVGIIALAVWHALVTLNDVPVYLVPSPLNVAEALVQDRALLVGALLVTLKVALLALALALVTGVLIAFVFVQSRLVERSLLPYAILLQVTPIVSIAPLIIIWAKNLTLALVLCAAMAALFPIIANTTQGLRSVDPGLLDLFRLHDASRWQTLVRLRIPSALPYFFAGLKVSSGLALIGTVVAEFVAGTGGSRSGLAYQILMAGINLNMPRLFAALFVITLAGVALYALASWIARLSLRGWHESEVASA
ncbi:MAG: ABC transporter permease [Burkholderiales bacterium]|nr:ABC transporter permease [Burkholderiales bacterium]